MHRNDEPDRTTGGLSTDDLAQPSSTTAGTPGEPEQASSEAPIYPGESTAASETQTRADEPGSDRSTAESPGTEAETTGAEGGSKAADDEVPQLLTEDEDRDFRDRWQGIQNQFVDDPREAVHAADTLVADVMQTLATTFAQHKKDLEDQWGQGEQVDTEELRRALRRYRSFFNRLLST